MDTTFLCLCFCTPSESVMAPREVWDLFENPTWYLSLSGSVFWGTKQSSRSRQGRSGSGSRLERGRELREVVLTTAPTYDELEKRVRMENVKVVKKLLISIIHCEIPRIESKSLLLIAADEEVPQIVWVEHRDQGETERKRNAES